ncbi:uncharacterized protein TNCV_4905661 [Trichonephila clavipes]|uniref:Uncharacterized protein n=1 Tax=Trichonephila clavipes TaxID=2585209 RepID=A0A8X6RPF6_TRICX|nr:uncharacterized protein TNCV_4905661 [Trichonephila clavipes]
MRPVPHSKELPIRNPPEHVTLDEESLDSEISKEEEETFCGDATFEPSCPSAPHLLTQEDLNDLIRDLNLSKKQSETLGSLLKGCNLLQKNTKICTYRSRHFQCTDYGLVFWNDISSLMETVVIEDNPIEWRFFIKSSKASLKTVLLQNGNKFPSIPVAHFASMKETYENFHFILAKLQNAVTPSKNQSSRNRPIIRHTHVEPTPPLAADQTQTEPSLWTPVSFRTLASHLSEGDLVSLCPLCVLPMSPTHRRLCLEWSHAWLDWTATEWNQVISSDKSRFKLRSDGRSSGEHLNSTYDLQRHPDLPAGVMIWGAIDYYTRSSLISIDGTMTVLRQPWP